MLALAGRNLIVDFFFFWGGGGLFFFCFLGLLLLFFCCFFFLVHLVVDFLFKFFYSIFQQRECPILFYCPFQIKCIPVRLAQMVKRKVLSLYKTGTEPLEQFREILHHNLFFLFVYTHQIPYMLYSIFISWNICGYGIIFLYTSSF